MNKLKFLTILLGMAFVMSLASCSDDGKSYAEKWQDERKAANKYLAQFRVVMEIPADSVFEVGPNAPYYRLDEDGTVYMQVLNAGDMNHKAEYNERVYFRYMRQDLTSWAEGNPYDPDGNANNVSMAACFFYYNNYTTQASSMYGQGIQRPLDFLGVGCEVNLVIKSDVGFESEKTYVRPSAIHINYMKSEI